MAHPQPTGTSRPIGAGVPVELHLARVHTVAALGRVTLVAGVGLLLVVLASLLGPGTWTTVTLVVAWVLLAVGALLSGLAAIRVLRPPVLARVGDDGLQVHVLRGGGPTDVPFDRVRRVRRERLRPGPCIIVELTDGQRTVVPERLVEEGGDALVAALRAALDRARGEPRLPRLDRDRAGGSGAAGGGGGGI